jgi:WhiB family redox-sensing transcriptional regulator
VDAPLRRRRIPDELNWQLRARCRDLPVEMFFASERDTGATQRRILREQAKQVCRSCQVCHACLDHALKQPERYGIWGATTPRKRQKMQSQSEEAHNP